MGENCEKTFYHPNHLPNVIKELPTYIDKRLSNHSSDEKTFKESAIYYKNPLNKAGYTGKSVYHFASASNQGNETNNCQWNVIWFNPPNSKHVATRISLSFLHLRDTHFQKCHNFNKISKKIKIKASYSCMQNIKAIINNVNKTILHQNKEIKVGINCRNRKYFPLTEKSLFPIIVYVGKITSSRTTQRRFAWELQKSHSTSNSSFTKITQKITELSKVYWEIKKSNFIPNVIWSIVRQ